MTQQTIAKGELLELTLDAWGRLGEAMARSGETDVFVFGGIPGERVTAEVMRVHRRYAEAQVVEVLEPSPWRVEPPCSYYGQCTGCQWQHMDYQHQLEVKHEKVVDALKRVGGFDSVDVSQVVPSPKQYGYRNHARFTIGRQGELGFVHRQSRRFVKIDRCMLMHDGINATLTELQDRCGETTQLSIRAGEFTGDTLVQPRLTNPEIPLPTGQKTYQDSIAGRPFRVASPSFFQVNVEQAAKVAEVVQQALDLKKTDLLVDAYMGVGAFAALLAPYVNKVIGIEESSAAVADAKENIKDIDNVELALGKTEAVLGLLEERPDAVVLDPPRAGCQAGALEGLLRLLPPKIAYVSCDAETLARDLKVLCEDAYSLNRVVPLDMFPQTHHVECVATLYRKEGYAPLVLASASPRRRDLLNELGLDFQVVPSNVPEEKRDDETPADMVKRLSMEKAQAVVGRMKDGYVIGADSTVVLNGEAYEKPVDAEDARRMLQQLGGTRHQVVTGVTVVDAASGRMLTDSMASDITLRNFTDAEMEVSIASGTPMDKAGAYAVQDREFRPAESWQGCYTNIIGLPLCRLLDMLREIGCQPPPGRGWPHPEECGPTCPSRGVETASHSNPTSHPGPIRHSSSTHHADPTRHSGPTHHSGTSHHSDPTRHSGTSRHSGPTCHSRAGGNPSSVEAP